MKQRARDMLADDARINIGVRLNLAGSTLSASDVLREVVRKVNDMPGCQVWNCWVGGARKSFTPGRRSLKDG